MIYETMREVLGWYFIFGGMWYIAYAVKHRNDMT